MLAKNASDILAVKQILIYCNASSALGAKNFEHVCMCVNLFATIKNLHVIIVYIKNTIRDNISFKARNVKGKQRGHSAHMHTEGGVSPRNFQATQKYHFSIIATQKYQLILYLETCPRA